MSFSTEENKKQYNGNDSTTVFSFPYPYQAKADLTVILTDANDADTTLVLDTHYSLTDPGASGSVTYPISGDPLAAGEVLTIVREMEFNQKTDLGNHGAYFLQALENALDKCTMQLQQVKEIVDRSVKIDITDTDSPPSVTDFNTALATVQALEAAFDNLVVQNHSAVATGSQTVFTMPAIWPDLDATSNVTVYDDGLKIDRDDYSVTGDDEITFDTGRTVGHTIIFELHEALSSDDLDSAISTRSDYNVIIDINGDYPSVAAYIANSPQAGDRVLIRVNENLSANLIIPDDIELKRVPGTKFTLNSVFTPVITFGNRVKTTGEFRLETNHTSGLIDKAFVFNGDDNHHENLILDINNAGSVTHGFQLGAKKGNYAQGRTIITGAGSISSELTDQSSNDLNHIIVINDSKIYRSSGAKKFEQPDIADFTNAQHDHSDAAGGGASPSFSVHKNGTNQTGVVTNTWTKLTWSTEDFDNGDYFASDKYTPLVAGVFELILGIYSQNAIADGELWQIAIYKNGASVKEAITVSASATKNSLANITVLVEANGSTDYFEAYIRHTHGSDRTVDGSIDKTYFMGVKTR